MTSNKRIMILPLLVLLAGTLFSKSIFGSGEPTIHSNDQNNRKLNQQTGLSNGSHQKTPSQATQQPDLNTLTQAIKRLEQRFEDELSPRENELKIWRDIADTNDVNAKASGVVSVMLAFISTMIALYSIVYVFIKSKIFKIEILQKNFDTWRKLQTLLAKIRSAIVTIGFKPLQPTEAEEDNAPDPTYEPIQGYIIAEKTCCQLLQLVPETLNDISFSKIKKIFGMNLSTNKQQITSQDLLNQIVQLADREQSPVKKLIGRYLACLANSNLTSEQQKRSIEKIADAII